jgi:BirA family biotin operon repressor/biotin-[acetyl-CoA-carboxylase] ligase
LNALSVELLNRDRIRNSLPVHVRESLREVRVEAVLESTNASLQSLPPGQQHGTVLLAECQTAGRGRRGRIWVSPPARNIYLSLGWRFDASVASLACLPLVVALAVCRSLASVGLEGHAIKWPNDIVINERKLGGCLVEVQGEARGPCMAVIGIGINVHMPVIPDDMPDIDQPWTDLARLLPDVSRNHLASALISDLLPCLNTFADDGFDSFAAEWSGRDALVGKEVVVTRGAENLSGVAQGINERGGLLLATARGIEEYHSGEVSVRPL